MLLAILGRLDAQPILAEDRLRLPAGLPPASGAVLADVDGDGRLDFVRAAADSVAILLQTAAGEFEPHPAQPALTFPAGAIRGVALGRMRPAAVLPDIVVVRATSAPLVLLNDGAGIYQPGFVLPAPPSAVASVLVGDLDRVPPDDLIVLPEQGRPQLLLGQSTSYRDRSQLFAVGLFLQSPIGALLDFDSDGDLDVALTSGGGSTPFVLENGGINGFMRQVPLPLTGGHSAIAMGDFDRDGRPDVALAHSAPLPAGVEFALNRVGGFAAYVPAPPFPLDVPVTCLRAIDLQGDGHLDLVALQSDGRVRVGVNDGQSAFQFAYGTLPLDPAPRVGLDVGDLEGDRDIDMIVAGGAVGVASARDSVLLARARGNDWVDTETVGFPIGLLHGGSVGAAVDVDGDAELDVVAYAPGGRGFVFRNDGTARFAELSNAAPALAMRDARRVLRASVDTPDRDLVVVASAAGGTAQPPGMRVLVNQTGRYLDVTTLRLPGLVQRGFADVAIGRVFLTTAGPRRIDDLVLADTAGGLAVLLNQNGVFSEVAGAFAPNVAFAGVRAVLVGDVDGDGRPDVVLVEQGASAGFLQVYLRSPTNTPPLFVLTRLPAVTFGIVSRALMADFDGDGDLDIVGVLEGSALAPLVFLAGNGAGDFVDQTSSAFQGSLPPDVETIAAVASPRQLSALLLGRSNGNPLLLLRRAGNAFASPEVQPVHGSPRATDLVVADFDTDGDDDCAILADGVRPGLLLGTDLQLAGTAVFQSGREVVLRARGPDPAAIGAWLWSPHGRTRIPFPGFGILRLVAPFESLAVFPFGPARMQDFAFVVPRLPTDATLWFQLAVFDPRLATFRLSNLEATAILAR